MAWYEEGDLRIADPMAWPDDPWQIGESIAVNGVCLTLVDAEPELQFKVSEETVSRTTLASLGPQSQVNLERAMRTDSRFGGHIVQGHVDTTGRLVEVSEADDSWTFVFEVNAEYQRFLVDKGSICVDGTSLTIVEPVDGRFKVAVIPHTFNHTNLSGLVPGDAVNIEFDHFAKLIDHMISLRLQSS